MIDGLVLTLTIAISAAIGAAIGTGWSCATALFWRARARQLRRRLNALREPWREPIPFYPPERPDDRAQETSEPG